MTLSIVASSDLPDKSRSLIYIQEPHRFFFFRRYDEDVAVMVDPSLPPSRVIEWRGASEVRGDTHNPQSVVEEGWGEYQSDLKDRAWWRLRIRVDGGWSIAATFAGSHSTTSRVRAVSAEGAPQPGGYEAARSELVAVLGALLGGVIVAPLASYQTIADREAESRRFRATIERQRKESAASLPESGFYPDLLLDTESVRGVRGEAEHVSTSGGVVHYAANGGRFHHFRFVYGGEAVSGLTLHARRKYLGKQSAVIDRVFTEESSRGNGFARALLSAAKAYFSKVEHSRELTADGRAWRDAVER